MGAVLPRTPHGVSVSSALPAQETRLAAPTPARRRTTRPLPPGKAPATRALSRRGRRVPAPAARAMDAALPRPPHGVSVSSALPAQETRLAAPTPARRRALRPHQPSGGSEGPRGPSECIRIARLSPVAQSSRRALAAPSARFAPHLRVALRFAQQPTGLTLPSGAGRAGSLRQGRKHSLRRFPPGSPPKEGEREAAQPRRKRSPTASFFDAHFTR